MKLFFWTVIIGIALIYRPIAAQQNQEIDSLASFVLEATNKSEKLQALNQLTFLLRERELDKALGYALSAESLAIELNDSTALGTAKGNMGWIHYRKGNWNLAFRYSKDAYLIGLATKNRSDLAMVLNNLGALYYQQTNYIQAISYFKEAYELALSVDDTYTVIRSLNNIALNYSKLNELDSALVYANEALAQNKASGSIYFTSFTMRVIGDVKLAKNEIQEAIDVYESALTEASHQRLHSFESSVFHRLGKAYFLLGNYSKAVELLEKGRVIAEEGGFQDELIQTYYNLYLVYDQLSNVPAAFVNLEKYVTLNKVREEASDKDKLKLIQGMFEVDRADAELTALKAESEVKNIKLQLYQRFTFLGVVAGFILITLMLWMTFLNRSKNMLYQQLLLETDLVKKQKVDLELNSKELELANTTKNKLLSIIGHDLKAPVAQLKGVLQLIVDKDLSKSEFEEIHKNILRNVDDLYINLDNVLFWSISQMEGFNIQKIPVPMIECVEAAFNLLRFLAEEKNVLIEIDVDKSLTIETDKNILTLILRNVLSNAIKFSNRYSVVTIKSSLNDSIACITIKDSGQGMSSRKVKELMSTYQSLVGSNEGTDKESGTGLGYSLINEFISKIDGKLQVESELGKGTKVSLLFAAGNYGNKVDSLVDTSEETGSS
ncbi:MAG: tetratricopeptide repeat-containing sensor histidine kinase [Mongoliitalea sp.]